MRFHDQLGRFDVCGQLCGTLWFLEIGALRWANLIIAEFEAQARNLTGHVDVEQDVGEEVGSHFFLR